MAKRSRTLPYVAAAGRGIVIQIQGEGESAKRALEMVREQLRETGQESERESAIFERTKQALETVGLYMGIREGVEFLKEFTAGAAEYGEQMQKASTKTGMTVETLSVLHYAADLAHTDFDQLQGGIGKMAVNMESAAGGNKKMAAAFQQAGIDAKDLAGRSDGVDIAFKKLALTLANTENAQQRDALAKQLMGKAGVELIPVLMDLGKNFDSISDGADKAGVKITQLQAEKLAALDDELDKMKESIKGAGLAFTEGLSPALVQVFGIISQGQNSQNMLTSWGEGAARIFAHVASTVYSTGSEMERIFSLLEGGKFTAMGRKDWEESIRLGKQSADLEAIYNGTAKPDAPKPEPKPNPTLGAGTPTDPEKTASANAIAEARAQLLDQTARTEMAKRKAADQVQLAEWETQHKLLLVSDGEFYAEKLKLQTDELDAEEEALNRKQTTLQALLKKQQGDGDLKRRGGTSAEELKTQRELQQVEEARQALIARRGQMGAENTAQVSASSQAAELAHLKVAAELEKQRNDGIEAQIALVRREHEEEAKRNTAAGGSEADAAAIRSTGEVLAQKLQIDDVGKRIAETEAEYRRRIDDTNDAASKGYLSKRQAAQQTGDLNRQEAQALQQLVEQYKAMAAVLGGDYKQKAEDLEADLSKLGRSDRTHSFGYQLAEGMESTVDRVADAATRGKASIADMARSIADDMSRLALKMAEQRFIAPLFENLMGVGGASGAAGGGGGVGGALTSLAHSAGGFWRPPQSARPGSGAGSAVAGIASAAASKLTPAITTNLTNNSSQPLQMGEPEVTYDEQLGQFVVNYIMNDHATGGPIRQLYGNG